MAQANPPTILDLEVEILSTILAHVCDDSPRTAPALAQVNRYFNDAVQLVQYRHTTLNWDTNEEFFVTARGPLPESLKTPNFLRGVRCLTIRSWNEQTEDKCAVQLEELLRLLTNLRSLSWDVPDAIPASVLSTLETKHPRAQLNIRRLRLIPSDRRLSAVQDGLASSNRLMSFGAHILGHSWIGDQHHTAFQKIISGAPSLRYASLITQTLLDVEADPSDSWRGDTKPTSSLRHLTLDGWPLSSDTLEHWSQFVDFNALESLKCSRGPIESSCLARAAQMLTNLKHVNLNLAQSTDPPDNIARAAQEYIDACSPLSTLSLWSWKDKVSLTSILSRHGPTLEGLHLHEREECEYDQPRQLLSVDDLKQIRSSCPKLKSFTCDLDRQTQFLNIKDYQDVLDELEKAKLDRLQVYLDSGMTYIRTALSDYLHDDETQDDDEEWPNDIPNICGGKYDSRNLRPICKDPRSGLAYLTPRDADYAPEDGMVTIHPPSSIDDICRFVGDVWKHVFASRTNGDRLLEIKFGEWESKRWRGSIHPDGQPQKDIRVYCRARPHDRDDKVGECQVLVQCCGGGHSKRFASG